MSITPSDDQPKLLEEAMQVVTREAFQMKRCLDTEKLMDALKHASNMLCELRTSMMSPKTYYELYMSISDHLRHLEMYLIDEFQKGRKVNDLYELVQYAGNIVPRLYLLVTVGSVYIKAKEVPTKNIMRDLVEMCRGVQHPLRGLFLRNYLLSCIKRDLPEAKSSEDGTIKDSIDFILLNFSEMNKLWVRMQHQGHSRERKKREKERQELRLLVGTNLVRLSSLEGVDVEVYKSTILPAVLEQVVTCKDAIAQEYLMECVIQVFPDEFHLLTLDSFLKACGEVNAEVNVKNIIISLIDRLALYAIRDDVTIPGNLELFTIFSDQVSGVIQARPEMPVEDVISLQVSLVNLALKCYRDKLAYVDKVLDFTAQVLHRLNVESIESDSPVSKQLVKLVKIPIDDYETISTALQLEHFNHVFSFFDYKTRHELAVYALTSVVNKGTSLSTPEEVTSFLDLISPLVKDQPDQPAGALEDEDFGSEQVLVGRLVTLLQGESADVQYQILSAARKLLGDGGEARVKYTLPAIVFQALRLARTYYAQREEDDKWDKKIQKIYSFCHQTISALAKAEFVEMSLKLFLQSAMTADQTPFEKSESVAYEFMSQAFQMYEEDISDSKVQMATITQLIGALQVISCFTEENFTPLSSKCALLASKLLKKPDQCRGVCICSHIFWSGKTADGQGDRQDAKQVLQCLQRALKVARTCSEKAAEVALYVEILNYYIYYYEKNCDQITVGHIKKIAELVRDNLKEVEGEEAEQIKTHFKTTIAHIEYKKANPGDGPSFADLQL